MKIAAASNLAFGCGVPGARFLVAPVEDQVTDFLDGRTHGEDLLHAIYDHVLDEPIPERLRAFFG